MSAGRGDGDAGLLPRHRPRGRCRPWCRPLLLAWLAACGGDPSGTTPRPRPPDGPEYRRVLADTLTLEPYVDSLKARMPGRDSNGYRAPTGAEREAMLLILREALAGRVARADTLAAPFEYDVEATVERATGDSLIVMVERAPVERGWGTYIIRPAGRAADIHVNHPLFDTNTPRVAAALHNACRCRALLLAGTHRDANPEDAADMARAVTSLFQAVHEHLSADAAMAVSVHGFARANHSPPTAASDVVLSLGADANGTLEADDDARALRDRLRDAGFVVGLVADDEGYTALTGSPNPQGRYSNNRFGHGRWIHMELAFEVRNEQAAWRTVAAEVAAWLADLIGGEASTPRPRSR